jgi:aminoglycoside phosphotransferase (APT) family kinase protein
VAEEAQDLLDEDRRVCLVHADLNPRNLLVDEDTLEVTGVLDWELAHAGSPYVDLGNLLRFERDEVLTGAVLSSYRRFMPATPDDLLERARAADLFALIDLAARPTEQEEENATVTDARALLVETAG